MRTRFELTLIDRQARLSCDGRDVSLDRGIEWPYRTVQEAVDLAVQGMAKQLNESVAAARVQLASRDIALEITAEAREREVAILHLHLAHGLPRDASAVGGSPLKDREPFYETFHFASDRQVIAAVQKLMGEWARVVEADASEKRRWEETRGGIQEVLGVSRDGRQRPVIIGIVGVTGAGKSSFINAILGRSIAPRAEAICTSALTELRITSDGREFFTVQWLPRERIVHRIAQLEGEGKPLMSSAANPKRKHELESLKRALKESGNAPGWRYPLTALPQYATTQADGPAAGVARVVVSLDHPLLAGLTLIDTPGLRDPDPVRRRIALEAAAGMDAWVYLAKGPDKAESSMIESDWQEMREQAHNDAGVLVLTKMDQVQDPWHLFRELRDTYRNFGWRGDVAWCAALVASALLDDREWSMTRREFDRVAPGFLADQSGLNLEDSEEFMKRLRTAMRAAEADRALKAVIRDYALDGSTVPMCLRVLGTQVVESGIRKRGQQGRDQLRTEVESARERVRQICERERRNTEICESVAGLQLELQQRREQIDAATARLTELEQATSSLLDDLNRKIDEVVGKIQTEGEAAIPDMIKHPKVDWSPGGFFSGTRRFDVFAAFDGPQSEEASRRIKEFATRVEERVSERGAFVTSADVRAAIAPALSNYTLHRWDSFVAEDYEKFWEWSETMVERLKIAAEIHAKEALDSIIRSAREKLREVVKLGLGALHDSQIRLQRGCEDLERSIKELEETLQRLRGEAPNDRALYETRLRHAEALLASIDQFQAAHFAADGIRPEPKSKVEGVRPNKMKSRPVAET